MMWLGMKTSKRSIAAGQLASGAPPSPHPSKEKGEWAGEKPRRPCVPSARHASYVAFTSSLCVHLLLLPTLHLLVATRTSLRQNGLLLPWDPV